MTLSRLGKMYKHIPNKCWKCKKCEGSFYHTWWTCDKVLESAPQKACKMEVPCSSLWKVFWGVQRPELTPTHLRRIPSCFWEVIPEVTLKSFLEAFWGMGRSHVASQHRMHLKGISRGLLRATPWISVSTVDLGMDPQQIPTANLY